VARAIGIEALVNCEHYLPFGNNQHFGVKIHGTSHWLQKLCYSEIINYISTRHCNNHDKHYITHKDIAYDCNTPSSHLMTFDNSIINLIMPQGVDNNDHCLTKIMMTIIIMIAVECSVAC